MQIETKFNRIERVIYTFDEGDIHNALLALAKIPGYQKGRRQEFEICEDGATGKIVATITVIHEQPAEANDGE